MTALLVLGFVGPSRADLLFSNLNQGDNSYVSFEPQPPNPIFSTVIRLASDFRTDDSAWTITSVAALMRNTDIISNTVMFSVFTDNGSFKPGTLVDSLETPASIPANASTGIFTSTGTGITLQPNTVYWLVAQVQQSVFGTVDWFFDSGQGTDAGSLFSTVPATRLQISPDDGGHYMSLDNGNFMFRLDGEAAVPEPSTLAAPLLTASLLTLVGIQRVRSKRRNALV